MSKAKRYNFSTILLASFIAFFVLLYVIVQLVVLRPLKNDFETGQKKIDTLKAAQEDQTELLDQINTYRDGLYALNLVLEARKNVISGSDEESPYLVYDFNQLLNDLRRLLPRDARVTKFQISNKGLVTLPVESIDYASLGRVLKSFKDSELFTEVKIPSGAQRVPRQVDSGWGRYFEYIYGFTLQAALDPVFWQNPMPFPDVDSRAYYAQAIRDLVIAGTIEGYPDGYFRPDQSVNRAEFFKVALFEFLSNDTISIGDYKKYIDLSEKDWHYQYIQLASKMGIAEGDNIGRFHPDQPISRIEALTTLLTIFDIDTSEPAPEFDENGEEIKAKEFALPFKDVDSGSKYYRIIRAAIAKGLLDNMGNAFEAEKSVTRAEIAYWTWKLKFDYL
ncbi:MAG: S-layer homology domain-containing protein [Patescibacteria group bacterium]